MPSSSIPVPGRDSASSPSSRKTNMDDLRRQISKLKADLEAERTKYRQLVRDKALESKRTQDVVEREKQKAIELVTKRLTSEHTSELRKIRENVAKEKENELRQVLKFKDEEVKALKQQVSEEKEKNRAAEEEVRSLLVNKSKDGEDHSEIERKLRSEIAVLKEQKQKVEEMYRLKASAETEHMELVRRMKVEHELELQKFIKDSKRESVQSLQQRRLTEKALEEKEHELAFKDQLARKLEAEKDDLQRQISLTGELEPLRRSSLRTNASFDTTVFDRLDDSPFLRKDRERELKKKNAELQGRMESLEKKCTMLEKENSKGGSVKATYIAEEKVKKLKKRNSELISIARQLEDKAKKLQEEKKLVEDANLHNNAGVEHVKRVYARQRAKDLAEHAKSLMTREKELEEVKRRLAQPQNSSHPVSEKLEELQSIIRQSAKERLWLEKQISNSELSQSPSPQPLHGNLTTARTLSIIEAENKSLKESVIKLRKAEGESFKLAEELKEKQEQNQKLVNDLEGKQTRCSKLELERERFAAKCTMLQKKNGELGKRLTELEEVENEVVAVTEQLNEAERHNLALSNDCKKLKSQVDELLQVKQDLKSMEQQKEKIEQDYLASVEKLKERQEEIRQLHKIQHEANNAHEMAVTTLEDAVRTLEQKCIDSEENNINLKKEMEELKEEERLWKRKRSIMCHKSTQTVAEPFTTPPTSLHKEGRPALVKEGDHVNLEPSHLKQPATAAYASPRKPLHEFTHVESSPTTQNKSAAESSPSQVATKNTETLKKPGVVGAADVTTKSDNILDDLSSRINELAASDSEDDTISENLPDQQMNEENNGKSSRRAELDLEALSRRINQVAGGDDTSSSSSISRERNGSDVSQDLTSMADGDLGDMEDNQPDSSAPEDEQADHSEKPVGTLNSHHAEPTNDHKLPGITRSEPKLAEESLDNRYFEGADDSDVDPAMHEKLAVYIARYSYDPAQHSPNENPESELAFQAGDYLYVFGEMDEDGYFTGELMSGKRGLVPSNFVEKVADETDLNMMVNGAADGMDDTAESSDEEETDEDESGSEEGETELTVLGEDGERQLKPVRMLTFSGKLHRALRLSLEHIPDVALDDITEEEEDSEEEDDVLSGSEDNEDASKEALFGQDGVTSDTDLEPFRVPSPRRLVLERQFTRSVLLSWKPAELPVDQIKGYSVYVNGELRLMIKGASKTKALLEDIDADETYRISVRTITTEGEESSDRSAVVSIGRDASLAPSHVQVTCVSPTSAKIEWEPGNSSFSHEIIVNGTLHRTVRPGTFQHTLTNLEPDHAYKVYVRAANPKRALNYDDEVDVEVDSLTAGAEFRTEPGGLPDPPLDVEVIERHSNSLEVNWIPMTITEKGTSNGARVTGYRVYINGFACTEVTSPTADCVTVVSWMVERAVKRSRSDVLRLVVRTQSCEGESTDSNEVQLPVKMFNFKTNQLIKPTLAELPPKSTVSPAEAKLDEVSNEINAVPEQTDSVRRYSRNESGQPQLVIADEAQRSPEPTQPRTKGKPVVWKYDASEDSEGDAGEESETVDSATNTAESSGSEDEDDEHIEVCVQDVPEVTERTAQKASDLNTNEYQQLDKEDEEEADVPEAEQHVDERNEEKEEEMEEEDKSEERTLSGIQDKPQPRRKDSDLSVVSDIDLEELGRSLDEAEAIPRRSPRNREDEDKKPYIRPLEYEESDFEDELSEQEQLSIIQEEDEEDLTESQALMSRVSQSHSPSEGFQSDDDVMDLLDEDHDRQLSPAHSVNVGSIRRTSPPTWSVEPPEDEISGGNGLGFGKCLATSQDESKSDISVESQDRLLDNIELEECEVGSESRDATYSDTEADHGEVERNSSPDGDEREAANSELFNDFSGVEQGVAHPEKGDEEALFAAEEQFPTDQADVNNDPGPDYQVRVFLALYDYDPAIMSPNPDAEEEELAFTEGDLIKVYGDKDEDGFYWGELDGRAGFIPYNMVSEVRLDGDESSISSEVISPSPNLNQDSTQSLNQSLQSEVSGTDPDDATGDMTLEDDEFEDPRYSANYQLPPRRMVAQFDYDPQTLSPNPDSEVELRFRVGDVILVYGDMDADGFYTGDLRGVRGLVPSNFLRDLSEPPDEPVYQESSHESSVVSNSSDEKLNTPNGTHLVTEDTSKKKKGIFSKGKQMFKKIAKGHNSPKSSGSKR